MSEQVEENIKEQNQEQEEEIEFQEKQIEKQIEDKVEEYQHEKSQEKALELKQQGGKHFQENQYNDALDCYENALLYCPDDDKQMLCILNSNIGICLMRQEQNEEAINYFTKAIEYDPVFIKAYLNRAALYDKADKPDEALEGNFIQFQKNFYFLDYKEVDELQPNNIDIIRRKLELQKKVDELNEKRKTEVLTGLKDLGNTILGKFGLSLDNFKMQQSENGSYNIQFKQ
ncbi:hypothetical protein pb186bvf_012032 [Paramecium bursaria]